MVSVIKHYLDIAKYLICKLYWDLTSCNSSIYGVVLMYHHITNSHVDTLASCQHKPEVFESTLLRLLSEGYKFVSIDEMLGYIKMKDKSKFAVVTFDDIMDNVFTNAYPILKKLRIPFTVFVVTGFIGKDNFITLEHLKEMDKDELCTVGAHTMSHCRLSRVENSYDEMLGSKKQLEELLGHDINYLAYPYGWRCDVNCRVMKEAKEIGFKCAFGTIQSPISEMSSRNLFYLPRKILKG